MLYRITNGAITLGNKTILEEINFEIKNQEHIAIIGKNGTGKTSLLRAINKEIELEQGLEDCPLSVTEFSNNKIGYINQFAIMNEEITMLDEILKSYQEILLIEQKLTKLEKQIENNYDEKLLNQYQDLYLHYQNIGGYNYKKEYITAIEMFGFTELDQHKKIKEFSYGQRTKIALLRLILSKPELLLLDEPTNHLDMKAIEWLEKYLKDYPKMLVIVSHDRMFLDNICNITYEIEYGCLVKYPGNYSYYEKQKELNYQKNLHDYERQQKEIERLTKIADRFRYKPTKASMALSKLKQIERMIKIEKPKKNNTHTFSKNFNPEIESYRDVLKVKDLKIGYEKVLGEVNFSLEKGQKLGIIGENGCGKSTFLKTIIGDIPKLGGKYSWGNRVEIAYFDQNIDSLNESNTILEELIKEFPEKGQEEIRRMLGSFAFTDDMVFQKINSLSGGQKVKLKLCKIMYHKPNVLLLDEPTNHLDIISKKTIEDLLIQYKGTVIFVSHDRYFINKISSSLLVFENNKINYYKESYQNYLEKRTITEQTTNSKETPNKNISKPKYENKLKEKTKLERYIRKLELEIENLENQINNYHQDMMKEENYLDRNKIQELEQITNKTEQILQDKMLKWENSMTELNTFINNIS